MTSTVAALPAGLWNYDANDRITTDVYDNNGNTTSQAGIGNTYDFENHLIQYGGVTIVYDGDGNRVAKTIGGVTTNYLVDTNNPTGYAQVLEEIQNNHVVRQYAYALDLISETQEINSAWKTRYYGYDGHGSVRYLTDSNANVTDTYDYDAFGNLMSSSGSTPNNYLYPDLNLYYNRARYLDVRVGRFWGMDGFEGDPLSPGSLHRYTYATANPVDQIDPSGNESLAEVSTSIGISTTLSAVSTIAYRSAIGALGGAAFGAITAALGGGDYKKSILEGAISGAVLGPVAGAAGAYRTGRIILALISAGAGGAGAYRAYKTKQYALAAFYVVLAVGGPLFTYLSESSATAEVAPTSQTEPITDPSRLLPASTENNPWLGETISTVTQEDRIYYRVYGGTSNRAGEWLTPVEPTSGQLAQEGLALQPGNDASAYTIVRVPAGTRIQMGIAGPNWGRAGGFPQIRLLDRIPGDNFMPGGGLGR